MLPLAVIVVAIIVILYHYFFILNAAPNVPVSTPQPVTDSDEKPPSMAEMVPDVDFKEKDAEVGKMVDSALSSVGAMVPPRDHFRSPPLSMPDQAPAYDTTESTFSPAMFGSQETDVGRFYLEHGKGPDMGIR